MDTDLNTWLGNSAAQIQDIPLNITVNGTVQTGYIQMPPLNVWGLDALVIFQIIQTVILMFLLYYAMRYKR